MAAIVFSFLVLICGSSSLDYRKNVNTHICDRYDKYVCHTEIDKTKAKLICTLKK